MNMKVMSKIALGGACLAAATIGVTMCNKDKNALREAQEEVVYVDNVLNEDVVEISKPAETTKEEKEDELPDVSYEHNYRIDKRFGMDPEEYDFMYKRMGTYGFSITQQAEYELWIDPFKPASTALEMTMDDLDNMGDDYDEQIIALDKIKDTCEDIEQKYMQDQLAKVRKLSDKGAPTLKQCEKYIQQGIIDSFKHLPEEDRNEEIMLLLNDFENFKKAQGKPSVQKQAELFAYQQYKLDSIASAQILEELVGTEPDMIWNRFELLHKNYTGKPKP